MAIKIVKELSNMMNFNRRNNENIQEISDRKMDVWQTKNKKVVGKSHLLFNLT